MTIPNSAVTEDYAALQILRQSQLHDSMSYINTQFNTYTKNNFYQFSKDVFGNTYDFNNDGNATLVTPLIQTSSQKASNETITGSWTFSNTVSFQQAVSFSASAIANSSVQPRSRVFLNTADQVISDSSYTAISFNAETYNVGGMHSIASNPTRITIQSGTSGIYIFNGQVSFAASNVGRREIVIFKNGSAFAKQIIFSNDAVVDGIFQVSCNDSAVANDFYELFVFQNSGGNLNVKQGSVLTFFTATKIW